MNTLIYSCSCYNEIQTLYVGITLLTNLSNTDILPDIMEQLKDVKEPIRKHNNVTINYDILTDREKHYYFKHIEYGHGIGRIAASINVSKSSV